MSVFDWVIVGALALFAAALAATAFNKRGDDE